MFSRNVGILLLQDYGCHNSEYRNELNIEQARLRCFEWRLRKVLLPEILRHTCFHINILPGLFDLEDGDRMFLRNVG
jgi:hypothetical protein